MDEKENRDIQLRRKSDKWQYRTVILLMIFSIVLSIFSMIIGAKAIIAIDGFSEFLTQAGKMREPRKFPESF